MTEQHNRFMPVDSNGTPRFAGIATFMRLPHVPLEEAQDVDIGLIGVPWDGGTTNRAGARHGPRQMRDQSSLMRKFHPSLEINPYQLANCADLGDTPVNPVLIEDTLSRVETFFRQVVDQGILPLTAGGDHLISLPVLRALAERHGPLGMVHFDAHTDTFDRYFGGCKYTHGTPFRRAIEEGVLDPKRTIQIGIRGGLYSEQDDVWGLEQGIRVIRIEEYEDLGMNAVIDEIHRVVGDQKTYVSFDVDCLDPVYAPGTGTPEVGGLNTLEAQRMLRNLIGLNLVGGDVVEVSPPFDPSGNTALVGATMMWEILCVLANNIGRKGGR
ncbi:agmatinase [Halomonas halocynthiae]|uniref:agmatinase n=1 Tax=Halomonas halocynthiae TaxID=176290 RepID=UPI0004256A78|nr:agmatinase [Halomonas halocynthiae]